MPLKDFELLRVVHALETECCRDRVALYVGPVRCRRPPRQEVLEQLGTCGLCARPAASMRKELR